MLHNYNADDEPGNTPNIRTRYLLREGKSKSDVDPIEQLDKHEVPPPPRRRRPNLLAKDNMYVFNNMKTQPIKDIQFKNLGNDPANYSTPPDDISIPSVMLLVAKPRSGKTRMVSNLFHRLKQAGSIDRILICSSTFHSNKKMMEELASTRRPTCSTQRTTPSQK